MHGLPKGFSSNTALAAIANLLDDEPKETEETDSSTSHSTFSERGGGKVSGRKPSLSRSRHRSKPYDVTKRSKSSVGEAELFFKMWKM